MVKKVEDRVAVEGKEVITLTWGDMAENGVGMQQLGELRAEGGGFTVADLEKIAEKFDDAAEMYSLNDPANEEQAEAAVLVIRDGVDLLGSFEEGSENGAVEKKTHDMMFAEQKQVQYDKKALMRGQVKNKKARWNMCIDDQAQEADYAAGKGTIVKKDDLPVTMSVVNQFDKAFGQKAAELKGEGNYYYNIDDCGIGFHGDAERRIVIAIRLGASLPIYYQWYQNSKPVGERIEVPLNGGDIYLMSEKAVGTDWRKRKIMTLRHATGSKQYVTVKK